MRPPYLLLILAVLLAGLLVLFILFLPTGYEFRPQQPPVEPSGEAGPDMTLGEGGVEVEFAPVTGAPQARQ